MDRRFPVYLLIDTSGSMKGEPIESVKVGIDAMISTLRNEPWALDAVNISIITYDRNVKQLLPLTPIYELQLPEITTADCGPTFTGAALKMFIERVDIEVKKTNTEQKGDWRPLLILITDGQPTDTIIYKQVASIINSSRYFKVISCAIGPKAKIEYLKLLTDNVYQIDDIFDNATIISLLKILGDFIVNNYREIVSGGIIVLPPPPLGVNIII